MPSKETGRITIPRGFSFRFFGAGFFLLCAFFATESLPAAAADVCCTCASSGAPKDAVCIKTSTANCGDLKAKTTNPDVKKLDCVATPLNESQCRKVADGGVCVTGPTSETAYKAEGAGEGEPVTVTPPELGVQIPGLVFSQQVIERERFLEIPFFAQYVSAFQRYLIGISIAAAAIMIVYGGFLYIVGSATGKAKKGKAIVIDALIGLVLVLGAYTILATINPDTVTLKAIRIEAIKPLKIVPETTFQVIQNVAFDSGYTPPPEIKKIVQENPQGKKPRVSRHKPNNPFDQRTQLPPSEIEKISRAVAPSLHIDHCIMAAIIITESGGLVNVVGHDEDVPGTGAGKKFLAGGVKFSGATFDKNTPRTSNDDAMTANPPDFGLDWRFSHGLGLSQCTIFPGTNLYCKDEKGNHGTRLVPGGTCFGLPYLMTLEGGLECLRDVVANNIKIIKTRTKTSVVSACDVFRAFVLGPFSKSDPTCSSDKRMLKKMTAFDNCKKGIFEQLK